jgi:hypothetical protein
VEKRLRGRVAAGQDSNPWPTRSDFDPSRLCLPNQQSNRPKNTVNEINDLKLLTKIAKSRGSEREGRKRAIFGLSARPAVNSPVATTLENNDNFRRHEKAENGFGQELGWGGRIRTSE